MATWLVARGNKGANRQFVLRVGIISNFLKKQLTHKAEYGINIECSADIGDWSSGMTGVSKTLSGSSILSSPAHISRKAFRIKGFPAFLFYLLDSVKYLQPLYKAILSSLRSS